MEEKPVDANAAHFQRRQRAYLVIAALLTSIALLSLSYGLWHTFRYTEAWAASDLARLLTSGFLFVFTGGSSVVVCLRLAYMEEGHRFLIAIAHKGR